MADALTKFSKFLALVLRHKPEEIGLKLDPGGWASVGDLLARLPTFNIPVVNRELLERVVAEDGKGRYAFSEDGTKIRAVQGHSIKVDLGLSPVQPPPLLYHGTARRFLPSIKEQGILRMKRQFVHLSADLSTARIVGARHGEAVVLELDSKYMYLDRFSFFLAENGVWLTEHVPYDYVVREL